MMDEMELKCRIAELNVSVRTVVPENRLVLQARDYLYDFSEKPDIKLGFDMKFLKNRMKEVPALSLPECEYIWTGFDFCRQLLKHGGFVLHSSAVAYKGRAYLFSAPSGTGKSTHTSIWQRVFGSEAVIINDDKPAIRLIDGQMRVFGTPWSGKSDINKNISVPLGGICFIARSNSNQIEKADKKSAIYLLLNQTLRHPSPEAMERLLEFMDNNLNHIPVFKMGCNMEDEAAVTAYEYMSKNLGGNNFYED